MCKTHSSYTIEGGKLHLRVASSPDSAELPDWPAACQLQRHMVQYWALTPKLALVFGRNSLLQLAIFMRTSELDKERDGPLQDSLIVLFQRLISQNYFKACWPSPRAV